MTRADFLQLSFPALTHTQNLLGPSARSRKSVEICRNLKGQERGMSGDERGFVHFQAFWRENAVLGARIHGPWAQGSRAN